MRILLATPYSPFRLYDHAASDTLAPLVKHLATRHEIHIVWPGNATDAELSDARESGCRIWRPPAHEGSQIRAALGRRPYWVREAWNDSDSDYVNALARDITPDVIHCEYLQTGELVLGQRFPTVISLHDVTTDVMRRAFRASRGWRRGYRWAEWIRTRTLERAVVHSATVPIALSRTDAEDFRKFNERTMHVPPGIDVGGPEWTGGKHEHPTVLFTGAMWREANERAVLRLALKVMPGVWQTNGEVRLRIVGARPTPRVRALNRDPRIDVVGHVDSIASEIHAASVIAAPTIYGGGVLMKVTKALGAGAPVVVDQATAQSIGLPSDAAAIVTSDEGFAVALDRILSSPERARRLGANARAFAKNALSWDSVVERYSYAYELAREANQ